MERARHVAARSAIEAFLVLLVVGATAPRAVAQAWVPPAHIGVVSFVYQTIDNTGHRLADGFLLKGFDSASRGLLINLDYAVTDRFSFSFGVPYIGSKYIGPEPSPLPHDECLCWNHSWQDFGATARYNLVNGPFRLTPSVSFGIPSHDYDYFGEAVVGRNLNETRIAVDAGQRLDAISDRLSVSGTYSYAFVEQVLGLPNNRSNITLETGIIASRELSGRISFLWQRSHGGLRSTEFETDEQALQFDRLVRDDSLHVAGGVTYSFPRFDVFANYAHYVNGTDTHAGHALSAGVSWPFER